MFKRLNSIQWKLTLSHFLVSSVLAVIFLFSLLQTANDLSQSDMLPRLRATLYESFVYDSNGEIEIESIFETAGISVFCVEPLSRSGYTFDTNENNSAINECRLRYRSIGIPTRETGFVMYRGIISVSIWDSENNLIHVTPSNLETEISELSGPQKEVLDWALHDSLRPHTNFVASGGIPKISSFHTDPSSRIKTEAVPLLNNDKTEVLGAVLVQTGPPGFFYIDPTFYLVSLGVLLGCLLFAFLGSFLISRNLRKRISSLQSYTSTWSDGNLSVRAEDSSTDEIGRLAADLNQMASQLEEMIDAKSLLASVETRQQLARDLHDAAKQQLFAANMQLSAVNSLIETEPQKARTHLDNASDLTKQAQQELSAVIDQLRPIQLRDSTFLAAVKQLIGETQKHQPINIQLDANITAPFTETAEEDLFRVLQEALNNIIKHSHATQVTLVLDHTASHTQLVVQDNGKGFDPSNQSSGFGLKSMEDRVRQLGGSFDIQSGDNGTKITIEISEGKTHHG